METNGTPPKPLPKPNPVTQAEHRRQMIRQVTWPLVTAILLVVGLAAALIYNQVGTVERWSQIATLFILLPAMLIGLILLGILAGIVFGLSQLLRFLPPYARLTQDAVEKVSRQIKAGAEISTKPINQIRRFIATIERLLGRTK